MSCLCTLLHWYRGSSWRAVSRREYFTRTLCRSARSWSCLRSDSWWHFDRLGCQTIDDWSCAWSRFSSHFALASWRSLGSHANLNGSFLAPYASWLGLRSGNLLFLLATSSPCQRWHLDFVRRSSGARRPWHLWCCHRCRERACAIGPHSWPHARRSRQRYRGLGWRTVLWVGSGQCLARTIGEAEQRMVRARYSKNYWWSNQIFSHYQAKRHHHCRLLTN